MGDFGEEDEEKVLTLESHLNHVALVHVILFSSHVGKFLNNLMDV